jgi:membrane protein YqaA with SNARE-associated domain
MHISLSSVLPKLILLTTVSLCIVFTLFLTPETLITYIGVENGYLLVLILAFVSGVSVFGVAPYHLMLMTLAVGGLNPLLLAAAATAGLGIGDSTSYLLGYHGRNIVPHALEHIIERISRFFEKHHAMVPVYIFIYGIIAPFSNDFIGVTLGILRYPFWRVMIPLLSGTFIFNTTLAYLSPSMYDTLLSLLSYLS